MSLIDLTLRTIQQNTGLSLEESQTLLRQIASACLDAGPEQFLEDLNRRETGEDKPCVCCFEIGTWPSIKVYVRVTDFGPIVFKERDVAFCVTCKERLDVFVGSTPRRVIMTGERSPMTPEFMNFLTMPEDVNPPIACTAYLNSTCVVCHVRTSRKNRFLLDLDDSRVLVWLCNTCAKDGSILNVGGTILNQLEYSPGFLNYLGLVLAGKYAIWSSSERSS